MHQIKKYIFVNSNVASYDWMIAISTIGYFLFMIIPLFNVMPYLKIILIGISLVLYYIGILIRNDKKQLYQSFLVTMSILIFDAIYSLSYDSISLLGTQYKWFTFWFSMIIAIELKDNRSFNKLNLLKLIITTYWIIGLTTIIGNIIYIRPSRMLAVGGVLSVTEIDRIWYLSNIGGYGYCASLIFLIPYLMYLYHIQTEHKLKRCLLVVILSICLCLIITEYFIDVALSFLGIIFCLIILKQNNKNKRIWTICIVFVCLFIPFLFVKQFGYASLWIAKKLVNTNYRSYADRFNYFADLLLNHNMSGDLLKRYIVYRKSIIAIEASPIIGNLQHLRKAVLVGGHSEILDMIARIGLMGLAFGMIIFSFLINRIMPKVREIKGIFIIDIILMIVFFLVNTGIGTEISLSVFVIIGLLNIDSNDCMAEK